MSKTEEKPLAPSVLYGHFGEIIGKVRYGDKSFTIQKHGRPIARLMCAEDVAEDVPANRKGIRRFPRSKFGFLQVTPNEFRSRMSDLLARVRFGNQRVLITYRGKVVAMVKPIK